MSPPTFWLLFAAYLVLAVYLGGVRPWRKDRRAALPKDPRGVIQAESVRITMSVREARGNARYIQELADKHGSVSVTNAEGKIVVIVHGMEKDPDSRKA